MSRTRAVLDACVLAPMPLADTLLRLAAIDLFRPVWSQTILDETARTLVSFGYSMAQVQRRISMMTSYFPEAFVATSTKQKIKALLPDSGDDHVLHSAIQSNARIIVTFNLKHFPADICGLQGVVAMHPDAFLVAQFQGNPDDVCETLIRQASVMQRPTMIIGDLLGMLRLALPDFVDRIEQHLS